jgi:hypothetical protein
MSQELVYALSEQDSTLDAYEALTSAISVVADNLDQGLYTVIWKSENHDHGSEYRVVGTSTLAKEDTLMIRGASRGGLYEIFPKSHAPPVIRYHLPSGDIGWEEEALQLVITSGQFAYEKEEEYATFFEFVKDKFGL